MTKMLPLSIIMPDSPVACQFELYVIVEPNGSIPLTTELKSFKSPTTRLYR